MLELRPLETLIAKHEKEIRLICWDIASAQGKEIFSRSAQLGGEMRKIRGLARMELLRQFIEMREIVSTQTVAQRLMKAVFFEAISTKLLNENFAKEGRKADINWVPDALKALEDRPEEVTELRRLYQAFEDKLKKSVEFWREDEARKYAEMLRLKEQAKQRG